MPPTTPRCAGSDGVSFAALRAAMPVWRPAFLARISHTHGPKRTPGNRNLLTRKTVTREARIPTDLTACRIWNTDSQLVAVKEQVFTGPPPSRWCRRSGNADLWPVLPVGAGTARWRRAESRIATHRDGFPSRRCPHPRRWRFRARPRFRSVSIAPLAPLAGRCSAQFSRWGLPCLRVAPPGGMGARRHVQRPRGAFCDSASAPEVERCGLAWMTLRHPRCLLRHAGIGDGSFAPLRGAMPV